MQSSEEICLDVDGRTISLQVRRESRTPSLHTGADLRELHGVVTTVDEHTHAWLSEVLPGLNERVLPACDTSGERAGRWLVSWNAYSVNATVHTYTLILREAEDLLLETLLVDDLELYPYEYREGVVSDGLAIWAKLVGTEDDLLRLRELIQVNVTFPVVRRGIHDEPRDMRLSLAEWSHFEGRIKYRIVLVDSHLGPDFASELVMVEEENSRAALSFYANFIDRLADHLVKKGLLGSEEIAEIRAAASAEPSVTRHDLWRVPDVDAR